MRLLVLSDLHREIWKEFGPGIDLAASRPDLVVLAGDIDEGDRAVNWAARKFAGLPVLYVHGNHEAYGHNLEEARREIADACTATPNIHFLDCSEFHIGNVRFLGATLWTDFCLFGEDARAKCMSASEEVMADYECIRLAEAGGRKLRAHDTAAYHAEQVAWLRAMLQRPHEGKTVVITHMAPSLRSVVAQYANDPVSAGFASNLDDMLPQADVWIHGHMHDSFDYEIDGCRVVCNPLGYQRPNGNPENAKFNPGFIVEV